MGTQCDLLKEVAGSQDAAAAANGQVLGQQAGLMDMKFLTSWIILIL